MKHWDIILETQIISLQLMYEQNQYFHSFLPSTIRDLNSLSEEQRNSTSVASFKHTLSQTNICVTKYFFVSDKRPQVLHTPLRAKCSALNFEIYLKT